MRSSFTTPGDMLFAGRVMLLATAALCLCGCPGSDGPPAAPDMTNTTVDLGQPDLCMPRLCVDIAGECGVQDDGCGGRLDCGPCAPTTLEVTPEGPIGLYVGETATLEAIARDGEGTELAFVEPSYASSDPEVVSVSAAGELEAIDGGTAEVTVQAGELSRTVRVEVHGLAASVAASDAFSCALGRDGTVACWGQNGYGQIGDQSFGDRVLAPREVPLDRAVTTVDVGGSHACVLDEESRALCWGRNREGQLGDGLYGFYSAPVAVLGPFQFRELALGEQHSCGLLLDGRVMCWGSNENRQLGYAQLSSRNTPSFIQSTSTFTSVAAGADHTCALDPEGLAHCWGLNEDGQLGDGSMVSRTKPEKVERPVTFEAIAAGDSHTCALDRLGRAWCWGANDRDQLGDGSEVAFRSTPEQVTDVGASFASITAGADHTCARTEEGALYCWGAGSYGQLGDGEQGNPWFEPERHTAPEPVRVLEDTVAEDISGGTRHSCALTEGRVLCWGANRSGEIGNGTSSDASEPVAVAGGHRFVDIVAARYDAPNHDGHTCAIDQGGALWCWGDNTSGQLGDDTGLPATVPRRVEDLDDIVAVDAAGSRTCALDSGGLLRCWGFNEDGAVGLGHAQPVFGPAEVAPERAFEAIALGREHTCGVALDGSWCWGLDEDGQLGNGPESAPAPAPIEVDTPKPLVSISGGRDHNCALDAEGLSWCWGSNRSGQLGDGAAASMEDAPVAQSEDRGWALLSSGARFTCALDTTGAARCWGDNGNGRLGTGGSTDSASPVSVATEERFVDLSSGDAHSCGITQLGATLCWGSGWNGQLGDGSSRTQRAPVRVAGDHAFEMVSSGDSHTCALDAAGRAWCWGASNLGQLGNDSAETFLTPREAKLP